MSESVTLSQVRAFVRELKGEAPTLLSNHDDPVFYVMSRVFERFKGGLGPTVVRPLVTVELYGANAAQVFINQIRLLLSSYRDASIGSDAASRMEDIEEALSALEAKWDRSTS